MENQKIENKVILTLDDYLNLRDKVISLDNNISELISTILNSAELNKDKTDLKIDSYYLKSDRILILLKKIAPTKYKTMLETLQKEEE